MEKETQSSVEFSESEVNGIHFLSTLKLSALQMAIEMRKEYETIEQVLENAKQFVNFMTGMDEPD